MAFSPFPTSDCFLFLLDFASDIPFVIPFSSAMQLFLPIFFLICLSFRALRVEAEKFKLRVEAESWRCEEKILKRYPGIGSFMELLSDEDRYTKLVRQLYFCLSGETDDEADERIDLAETMDTLLEGMKYRSEESKDRLWRFFVWVADMKDIISDLLSEPRLDSTSDTVEELAKQCGEHAAYITEVKEQCTVIVEWLNRTKKLTLRIIVHVEDIGNFCKENLRIIAYVNDICFLVMANYKPANQPLPAAPAF